ncbi:hypothetical protein AB0C81_36185 [Streptomyces roseoverticillatus]|uniref:hypothetical protein n=1 Tax=Streptomyces roseoverticillatus TaxID=66429 RepID=UPI0033EB2949
MPNTPLTCAEQNLITAITTMSSPGDPPATKIVLAQGRLFTPRPRLTSGAPRRGAPAHCFAGALRVAGAYVVGATRPPTA